MNLKMVKTGLAFAVGAAWLAAFRPASPISPEGPGPADCAGCVASAVPASQHFPALPPGTCGVLFNIFGEDGSCELQEPEPNAPCVEREGCYFWYQVLCQGECGNVVPMLFGLGSSALPLYTPCGTNQELGVLGCGNDIEAHFMVWDVTQGATAVKTSLLICSGCGE